MSSPPEHATTPPAPAALPAAEHAAIVAKLGELLGPKRVEHSMAVGAAAAQLARRHAPDLAAQAEMAGLVHDSAKKLRDAELMDYAARFDIDLTPGERETPQLLHGKVGAALLPERFGITDAAVVQAVRDHVTGRAEMGMLSQLLFVADHIAAGRVFPGVEEQRVQAQHDLRAAVSAVASDKIKRVLEQGGWLEQGTVDVWNRFRPQVQPAAATAVKG